MLSVPIQVCREGVREFLQFSDKQGGNHIPIERYSALIHNQQIHFTGQTSSASPETVRRKYVREIYKGTYNLQDAIIQLLQNLPMRHFRTDKCRQNPSLLQILHLVLHQSDKRLITRQIPGFANAGTWKVMDLPPPVGISANVSCPDRMLSITSACPGRNPS